MQTFEPVQTPEQIQTVVRLAHEIWHECYADILEPNHLDYMVETFQSLGAVEDQISRQGYLYYLALQDERPVGYLGVQANEGKLFLSKIYSLSKTRGTGFGQQMLAFAEQLAQEKGCRSVWLTVNRHNTRAQAAYKKRGYALVRAQVADVGHGYVMDDYVFEKEL